MGASRLGNQMVLRVNGGKLRLALLSHFSMEKEYGFYKSCKHEIEEVDLEQQNSIFCAQN